MTNRNVVQGFSLVPGLGLHDLDRPHYRRVGSLGGEIATPRQVGARNDMRVKGKEYKGKGSL